MVKDEMRKVPQKTVVGLKLVPVDFGRGERWTSFQTVKLATARIDLRRDNSILAIVTSPTATGSCNFSRGTKGYKRKKLILRFHRGLR